MYVSGEVYDGDSENGKKHGKGTIVYSNGDTYEGEWHNDKRVGRGTMTF